MPASIASRSVRSSSHDTVTSPIRFAFAASRPSYSLERLAEAHDAPLAADAAHLDRLGLDRHSGDSVPSARPRPPAFRDPELELALGLGPAVEDEVGELALLAVEGHVDDRGECLDLLRIRGNPARRVATPIA